MPLLSVFLPRNILTGDKKNYRLEIKKTHLVTISTHILAKLLEKRDLRGQSYHIKLLHENTNLFGSWTFAQGSNRKTIFCKAPKTSSWNSDYTSCELK